MLLQNMKGVIKYAIELDIEYLETFLGYKGDKVLKIITKSQDVVDKVKHFAENLDLFTKSEYDKSGDYYGCFVMYIGVEDHSVFQLKRN